MCSLAFSCTTVYIEVLDIADIRVELIDIHDNSVKSVTPVHTYKLRVIIVDNSGNIIDKPNFNSLNIQSLHFKSGKKFFYRNRIEALPITFRQLENPEYLLSISIKNNIYPIKFFRFNIDWKNDLLVEYRGDKGDDGDDGNDGADGNNGSNSEVKGVMEETAEIFIFITAQKLIPGIY